MNPVAPTTPLEYATLVVLIVLPLADLVATAFFARLFVISKNRTAQSVGLLRGRSWLLALMTYSNLTITSVFFAIGFLALRRLSGLQPLPEGALITLLFILWLGTVPIAKMAAFLANRRRRGQPPPFSDVD